MANTSKPQVERRGNYIRDMAFGRWRWLAEGGRPITEEVQVGNWILKPDGTKVHVTARQANRQAARQANIQANKQDQNFDGYYIFPNPQDPNNLTISPQPQQPINQVKKRVIQRRPNYTQNFNNLNLSDAERKYIENAGFNPNDARSVQEFILSKSKNANLGARKGAGIADGYWGEKSAAAFQALRNQNIFTPIVDEQKQSAPVIEQPIDAPDPFGYTTSNHYDDGIALKRLGFNNYAGLQAYAKTSEDQFAKDLKQRFGNDVSAWNQAKVESTLGVSGKYRGGRAGDFGDMARSMATWAGIQNGAYDQKEIASRSDSEGNVYSNSKVAQLFDKAGKSLQDSKKSQFIMNTPTFNFNLKQGNIGTNTLGNPFSF